jgi:hypothetical protein
MREVTKRKWELVGELIRLVWSLFLIVVATLVLLDVYHPAQSTINGVIIFILVSTEQNYTSLRRITRRVR